MVRTVQHKDRTRLTNQEIILAQEQSVLRKIRTDNEVEGTLILTDKRIIFVGATEETDLRIGTVFSPSGGVARLRFTDVNDLNSIPSTPENLSIPLNEVELEKGEKGFLRNPRLQIKWKDSGVERKTEFIAEITDPSRKKGLKDWAKVIDSLKAGTIKINYPSVPPPTTESLEGKVLYILGDMQDKGTFEIEEQTENLFKLDLDPDDVEAACKKLVSAGLVDLIESKDGDSFFRKRSPLGSDDLSS